MSLNDRSLHNRCDLALNALEAQHLRRRLPALSAGDVDLSSNDYLGLSKHPRLLEAGVQMAQTYGAGSTGSRLLSGNLLCFEALEHQVAQFKRHESALVFSTGYQANASVLSTLLSSKLWGETPLVFTDRLIHASLHHACQLAGIKQIRFTHNDLTHLEELLAQHDAKQRPHIIVVESVYGMDGDIVDMPAIATLAKANHSMLYIDEAHATGVMGPEGRGLAASEHDDVKLLKSTGQLVVMGTFSKAVGVSGAYVACSAKLKEYLVNHCKGFIYSTAPSPFTVGAIGESLRLIISMDEERARLHKIATYFRNQLDDNQLNYGASATQIVPVILGDADKVLSACQDLRQAGFIASAIRPPTVPAKSARLRLALNCGISTDQITALCDRLAVITSKRTGKGTSQLAPPRN